MGYLLGFPDRERKAFSKRAGKLFCLCKTKHHQ